MFESITQSLGSVFDRLRGAGKLTEENITEALREVRVALLEADVSYKVAQTFLDRVRAKAVGEEVTKNVRPGEMVVKVIHDELVALLGGENQGLAVAGNPTVIMLCGLQGSGKTTTVGKLAVKLLADNRRPLLAAADVQRPAAIEQLRVLGRQINVPVYAEEGGDPVRICERAVEAAKFQRADVVLLDTAGRLHVDDGLMLELESIASRVKPHEILLVLDAMTGQDAVHSAEEFSKRLRLTGAILTKLDGDTRGGAALSLREITGVPIKFTGVGEKLEALEEFHPDRMAGRILGMGDIVSLVEKAQAAVDENEQKAMQEKLLANRFTLADFQKQLEQMRKIGSIKDLLGMIPGLGGMLQGVNIDEEEFDRIDAIINSMNKAEREDPETIDYSRRERIAKGSGTEPEAVTALLKQFLEMKRTIGKLGRSGALAGMMGQGGMPGLSMSGGGRHGGKSKKDKKKERKKNRKKRRR